MTNKIEFGNILFSRAKDSKLQQNILTTFYTALLKVLESRECAEAVAYYANY